MSCCLKVHCASWWCCLRISNDSMSSVCLIHPWNEMKRTRQSTIFSNRTCSTQPGTASHPGAMASADAYLVSWGLTVRIPGSGKRKKNETFFFWVVFRIVRYNLGIHKFLKQIHLVTCGQHHIWPTTSKSPPIQMTWWQETQEMSSARVGSSSNQTLDLHGVFWGHVFPARLAFLNLFWWFATIFAMFFLSWLMLKSHPWILESNRTGFVSSFIDRGKWPTTGTTFREFGTLR